MAFTPKAPEPRTLESDECRLEPLTSAHEEGLWSGLQNESDELFHHLFFGPFQRRAELSEWIAAREAENEKAGGSIGEGITIVSPPLTYAILSGSDHNPVGTVSLLYMDAATGSLEIGSIWILSVHRSAPVLPRAVGLLLHYVFDELGFRRVVWKCDATNLPSRNAASSLGFRYEGLFRAHVPIKGRIRDTIWYAMTAEGWPEARKRIESRIAERQRRLTLAHPTVFVTPGAEAPEPVGGAPAEPTLRHAERFPRSARYSSPWIAGRDMGPNALWLMEYLLQGIESVDQDHGLKMPGHRDELMDLGCGMAATSVFLVRETGSRVWAPDLWVSAEDNLRRARQEGLEEWVIPVHADARALPFPRGWFDGIVSVDAYHYFGTEPGYLSYIARFLKPGGILGFVVPGLRQDIAHAVPDYLAPFWEDEFSVFHTTKWWRDFVSSETRSMLEIDEPYPVKLEVVDVDEMPGGFELWLEWERYLIASALMNPERGADIEMLEADAGRNFCFVRVILKRSTT